MAATDPPGGGTEMLCGACKQPVKASYVEAFGMPWHVEHLLCKVCGCQFVDMGICQGNDGYAYCLPHWQETFCVRCGTCGQYIEGEYLAVLDKYYHRDHLLCVTCGIPLGERFHPGPANEPLCERDYYRTINMICRHCDNPISTGKYTETEIDGEHARYHIDHFCCAYCKVLLADKRHKVNKGKPYCGPCALKLFG